MYSFISWQLCWEPYCLEMLRGQQERGVVEFGTATHCTTKCSLVPFFLPFSLPLPLPLLHIPLPLQFSLLLPFSLTISLPLLTTPLPLPFLLPPSSNTLTPFLHSLHLPLLTLSHLLSHPPFPLPFKHFAFSLPLHSDVYDSSC